MLTTCQKYLVAQDEHVNICHICTKHTRACILLSQQKILKKLKNGDSPISSVFRKCNVTEVEWRFYVSYFGGNRKLQLNFSMIIWWRSLNRNWNILVPIMTVTETSWFRCSSGLLFLYFSIPPKVGQLTGHHSKNLVPCSSRAKQLWVQIASNIQRLCPAGWMSESSRLCLQWNHFMANL